MTAPSPGIIAAGMKNEYYDTEAAYLAALAAALQIEYEAIVANGFLLQLDCPDLALERHLSYNERPLSDFLGFVERVVETINEAIVNVPRDRVRLHVCWGNYEGPHDRDVPLEDILPILQKAKVGGFVLPFANPRHQHEWRVLQKFPLADDQIIVAGVIDDLTGFVEHPEVVADRLENVAQRGRRPAPGHGRHRLRLRHLGRHGPGHRGRGLGQAEGDGRRRPHRQPAARNELSSGAAARKQSVVVLILGFAEFAANLQPAFPYRLHQPTHSPPFPAQRTLPDECGKYSGDLDDAAPLARQRMSRTPPATPDRRRRLPRNGDKWGACSRTRRDEVCGRCRTGRRSAIAILKKLRPTAAPGRAARWRSTSSRGGAMPAGAVSSF